MTTIRRNSSFPPLTRVRLPASFALVPWRTVAAFVVPLLLYLLTMAPTVYNLDSAEMTTAAYTGGIMRATGYPLYLLIGRFWSQIPLGDVGFRMNLFSAVCGAASVMLTERILRRWQIGNWATFGALGLLTVSTYFWALSLIAEVYTFHTVFVAAVILLLLRWQDHPTPARLALVGLTMGLSATHHAATVLLVPACIWWVLTVAPRKALQPRAIIYTLAAFVLGLCVYLYLPFAYSQNPVFNYAGTYDGTGRFVPVNLYTVEGMWWLISGQAFRGVMLAYSPIEFLGESRNYAVHLWRAFFAVGIGPGLLGLVLVARRNWRLAGLLILTFVINAAFYINYRVIDKDTMFLPTYIVWALWVGVGLQWLLDSLSEMNATTLNRWGQNALRGAIALSILAATVVNWNQVNLHNDVSTRVRGELILESVRPNAIVFGWWETAPPVEFLQKVEGQRPDVLTINRFLISGRDLETLIANERGRRPLYFDTIPAGLEQKYRFVQDGLLYRLR